MHLLIPFASALAQEALQVLPSLALPNLERLLKRLTPQPPDRGDANTLSPPHERALAAAWGWRGDDGALPFAALAAAGDGVDVQSRAWGLVTPAHWQVGRDHITMADPDALGLPEHESRALFEAVRAMEGGRAAPAPSEERKGGDMPANTFVRWTPEEEERLAAAFDAGKSSAELAKLHNRSRAAIEARLLKLGKIDVSALTVQLRYLPKSADGAHA